MPVPTKEYSLFLQTKMEAAKTIASYGRRQNPHEKRKENWTDDEAQALITIWSDNIDDLRRVKRNRRVYEKMAHDLNHITGGRRQWDAIQRKVKNLTAEYRKEKKKMGSCGGGPSSWRHYDAINELLGCLLINDDTLMQESMVSITDEAVEITEATSDPSPSSFVECIVGPRDFDNDQDNLSGDSMSSASTYATPSAEGGETSDRPKRHMFMARKNRNKKGTGKQSVIQDVLSELKAQRADTKRQEDEMITLLKEQNKLFGECVQLQANFNSLVERYLNKNQD